MKIIINHKNLSKILLLVERLVSKNPSLPILNNILLKTENGRLKISATNLELGINSYLGAKIEETGEITIPARIFSDFINNIKEEKIIFNTKNNVISINGSKYKTQILGFDAKDFPIIPKIKNDNPISIPAGILKNTLSTVLESVALSESRPELAGVYVQFLNNKIIAASTDSFRLTEKTAEFKNKKEVSFILPRNTIVEIIRIIGEYKDDIYIHYNDNQICLCVDDIELISRIIDGNYPDYKKVIPEKFISKVLINKNQLETNCRLAGLFSSNISDIKISCEDKSTNISAKNSDRGEINVNIESLLKNEKFSISLNYHYLLDGLKIIPTQSVILEYTGEGSPLILRPEYESNDLVYLIMPLRR